jgi:Flp pilus assembly pilin Flp
MVKMTLARKNIVNDVKGANLVEYIILVGLVALFAAAGFKAFGGKVKEKINQQAGAVEQIDGTLAQ